MASDARDRRASSRRMRSSYDAACHTHRSLVSIVKHVPPYCTVGQNMLDHDADMSSGPLPADSEHEMDAGITSANMGAESGDGYRSCTCWRDADSSRSSCRTRSSFAVSAARKLAVGLGAPPADAVTDAESCSCAYRRFEGRGPTRRKSPHFTVALYAMAPVRNHPILQLLLSSGRNMPHIRRTTMPEPCRLPAPSSAAVCCCCCAGAPSPIPPLARVLRCRPAGALEDARLARAPPANTSPTTSAHLNNCQLVQTGDTTMPVACLDWNIGDARGCGHLSPRALDWRRAGTRTQCRRPPARPPGRCTPPAPRAGGRSPAAATRPGPPPPARPPRHPLPQLLLLLPPGPQLAEVLTPHAGGSCGWDPLRQRAPPAPTSTPCQVICNKKISSPTRKAVRIQPTHRLRPMEMSWTVLCADSSCDC